MPNEVVRYWKCTNVPEWVEYIQATELNFGFMLYYKNLRTGHGSHATTFKNFRAVKKWVTENLTGVPSKWAIDNN